MAKKPSTPTEETAVRDAAQALHDAIAGAERAGYRVHWPVHFRDLPGIAVSETAKVERTRVIPVADTVKAAWEGGTMVSEVRTRLPASENVEVVEKTVEVPAERK
jgi:hypothetical protein